MSAWLRRFGLHLAAAIGATGIFVAAAAVGAQQNRSATPTVTVVAQRTPGQARRTPDATASPASTAAARVLPERSLAGTIRQVDPDSLLVQAVSGREWRVTPAPGALIRLNGKSAPLDALSAGDSVVILGQAEPGAGAPFLAHAITARRKS